jgi:signal transduction histidine kinase
MWNTQVPRWYQGLYQYISRERISRNDLDTRIIHAHLTMVFSTGILMWSYAILAITAFASPIPGIVGVICSLIHLLSPLLFLVTSNAALVCGVALFAGMVHQLTFVMYSGGFESCILMWLPILPLLAGFIEGRRCLLLWTGIVTIPIGLLFGLHLAGVHFPILISHEGYHIAEGLLHFGWLFLIFCTTWVHVSMKEYSEEKLRTQSQKIDDLFRVLFHDLANSLGRINIGMNLAEREQNSPGTIRGLQIIRDGQGSMTEITQNVRRMYAVSKGKAEVDLAPNPLNNSIEYIQKMFASDLEKKNLSLIFDFEKNQGLCVFVDQVSFNNQVLGNIVSNAIKFSHPGGTITISCSVKNEKTVVLEVKDSGIGMPDVLAKSLFDMNKRTSRSGTSGEGGTGFGMHIMKSFMEMYQGEVEIESQENAGTLIRLYLKGGRISGKTHP